MRSKLIWVSLILIWSITILTGYFVFHKPFGLENITAIAGAIYSLAAAWGVVSVSAGAGRTLLKRIQPSRAEGFPALALEFGIGFGLLSFLWLLLALLGLLKVGIAWLVMAALISAFWRPWRAWWRDVFQVLSNMRPDGGFSVFMAFCVGVLGVVSLIWALTPPHAWDALLYHLTSPLRHIQASRLVVDPALPESGYPQLVEMHYTWLLLLGAPRATAVVHWFFGVLTALMAWEWSRRWAAPSAGWLALAMLFTAETWTKLMGVSYIDLAQIFFTCLSFQLLLQWIEEPSDVKAMMVGAIAGLGFGVKYTAAFTGLALLGLMIWRRPKSTLRSMIYFGIPALLISLPWLIKNFIQVGNPFYPFLFEGLGWDTVRAQWYSQVGSGLLKTNPIALVAAPFIMTILGAEGAETWHASFGPLMLMAAPALLYSWKVYSGKPWFRYGLGFTALNYAFWLYGAAVSRLLVQPRLLFPILPIMASILGAALIRLSEIVLPWISTARIINALFALVLILSLFNQLGVLLNGQALQVVLGWEPSEDFLYQSLGWYHGAIRRLDALPEVSRVLFLFEPRSYYCPDALCIPDGVLDRWYWLRQQGLTNDEILARWQDEEISHVLVYSLGVELLREGNGLMSPDDWEAFDRMVREDLIEIENFGEVYILYQLPVLAGCGG